MKRAFCTLALLACDPLVGPAAESHSNFEGLVINEVAAAGRPHDWFELYNGSGRPISLAGLTYSDHPADVRRRASLEPRILAPGEHFVVVLSGAPGYRLGASEALVLFAPDGARIDGIDWGEGDAPRGRTLARVYDGSPELIARAAPTPGEPNRLSP